MSRVYTNSMTPFCGACKKAGKTPQEYNSHCTNTKGILTCPFILSSECGYCHQLGHWTKSCSKLANRTGGDSSSRTSSSSSSGGWSFSKKPANKYVVSDNSSNKHASSTSSTSKQKNLFSNLLEDSDTESESDDEVESIPVPIKVVQRYNYFDKPHGRILDWAAECSDSDDD
jgi:hypothetical protein